ncbi:Salivary acidic proline-rich phosphoprotein 1/2, partial [Massospora cicadina]
QSNQVTIVISETGSGKSTQIPQYLLEDGFLDTKGGGVVITQPRKVACLSLAERVAAEVGCKVGGRVGYSVRFDDRSSSSTIIKYATDGMVLRELISDPKLSKYKYIILDEAHERTLRNDILLGHVKSILKARPDCRLIVMSATLDSQRFSEFFDNAPVIKVAGRGHPVAILTTQDVQADYIDAAIQVVLQIHLLTDPKDEENVSGKDILVFLPGQEEIEACMSLLKRHLSSNDLPHTLANMQVFPLFAGLPAQQQAQALKPLADRNWRKCILATNIAETSLTIPGSDIFYRPSTGMETLHVQPISKSGAAQRAGRAGREGPGICYRLYPYSEYLRLPASDIPEIQRCNLDASLLTLLASGVDDLAPLGKRMAHFPLDPRFSRVVLASQQFGCTQEVLLILAALSVDNLFYSPQDRREEAAEARRRFINPQSDHLTYLTVMREFAKEKVDPKAWCAAHFINHRSVIQAQAIHTQLRQLCLQVQLDPEASTNDEDAILKCILQGCFLNTALLMPDGRYRTVDSNQEVRVHPSSVMLGRKVEALVFNELVETSHPYLRGVSSVQRSWIAEAAPHALAKRALN